MKEECIIFLTKSGFIRAFCKSAGIISFRENKRFSAETMLFSVSNLLLETDGSSYLILKEAELIKYFYSIQNQVEKYFIASIWTEITLKAGISGDFYLLLKNALFLLDETNVEKKDLIHFQFLWRLIYIMGFLPGISLKYGIEKGVFFSKTNSEFTPKETRNSIYINKDLVSYIKETQGKPLKEAINTNIDAKGLLNLIFVCYLILGENLNFKIKSAGKI